MPTGIQIQNGADVQHFYTAADKNNANNVVFSGNLDPGEVSPPFDLVAGADGRGIVSVAQAGEVGVTIFVEGDNHPLVIKEQTEQ